MRKISDIRSKLTELYSLEQLSMKNTVIHKLHPFSKLFVVIFYIICVVSVGRYDLQTISFYFFYPAITVSLAEIPFSIIIKRTFVVIPFCIFAGISNIVFDRSIIFHMGNLFLTGGICSFIMIILKSFLCVSACFILIASTPFQKLIFQFKRMYVPNTVIMLIEMIYRYIGVLMNQTDIMIMAYRLRSPNAKFPHIKDMGPFIGQLFLHSIDRAERIYSAMKCRGYGLLNVRKMPKEKIKLNDFIFMTSVILSSVIFLIMGR